MGSIVLVCKGLDIIHHSITIGNIKANRQVERTIWILKDCTQCSLTKEPAFFWKQHLALPLLLLYITAS